MNRLKIFSYSDIIQPTQFSHRQSTVKYTVKIWPLPQKNLRKNINAYYLVLVSDKEPHKIFSQPILIDLQRQNDIYTTNDIEYNRLELWNYDKMKMVEQQKTAFTMCEGFTFVSQTEEITYSVAKAQVAKSNKNIQPVKSNQFPGGRKNSQGECVNSKKEKTGNQSNKTESEQESSQNTKANQSPSYRIISAKQYHAY